MSGSGESQLLTSGATSVDGTQFTDVIPRGCAASLDTFSVEKSQICPDAIFEIAADWPSALVGSAAVTKSVTAASSVVRLGKRVGHMERQRWHEEPALVETQIVLGQRSLPCMTRAISTTSPRTRYAATYPLVVTTSSRVPGARPMRPLSGKCFSCSTASMMPSRILSAASGFVLQCHA